MINLGRKEKDWYGDGAPAPTSEAGEDKMVYPEVYISKAPKELLKIGDKGTITFQYEVTERSERTRPDGEEDNSISLRLTACKPSPKSDNPMDGLDEEEEKIKPKKPMPIEEVDTEEEE